MQDNSKILGLVLVVILVVFGSYRFGLKNGVESGKKEIAELNQALGIFIPPTPTEVRSVSGEIKEITSKNIILEINFLGKRNLPGQKIVKEIVNALIDEKTIIEQVTTPDIGKLIAKGNGLENLSFESKIKKIQLTDLKVGDTINVSTQDNIKEKKTFQVTKIEKRVND
jgi:hypothetical protein